MRKRILAISVISSMLVLSGISLAQGHSQGQNKQERRAERRSEEAQHQQQRQERRADRQVQRQRSETSGPRHRADQAQPPQRRQVQPRPDNRGRVQDRNRQNYGDRDHGIRNTVTIHNHEREIYVVPPRYAPSRWWGPDYRWRYGPGYRCHPYPYGYRRVPFGLILVVEIPIVIFDHPVYRDCDYVSRQVTNLSRHRAQILINDYPYYLRDGRDFLYPGESAWVRVPVDRPYDLDASVYDDGYWVRTELEAGAYSDLIIPPVD